MRVNDFNLKDFIVYSSPFIVFGALGGIIRVLLEGKKGWKGIGNFISKLIVAGFSGWLTFLLIDAVFPSININLMIILTSMMGHIGGQAVKKYSNYTEHKIDALLGEELGSKEED